MPSVRRLEESKIEPATKLESVDEIRKRRLGGGSEENSHLEPTAKKVAAYQRHRV